jgi:hypothetical protein
MVHIWPTIALTGTGVQPCWVNVYLETMYVKTDGTTQAGWDHNAGMTTVKDNELLPCNSWVVSGGTKGTIAAMAWTSLECRLHMGAGYASRPAYIQIKFVGALTGHHRFDIVGLANPNLTSVYVASRIELVRCESNCTVGLVPITNLKDIWYERYAFYFGAKLPTFTTETRASSPTGLAIRTAMPAIDILAQHSDAPLLEIDYDYMLFTYPTEMYAPGIVMNDSAARIIEMIKVAPGSTWLYLYLVNVQINSSSSKIVMKNASSPKGGGTWAAATTITYVKENVVWAKTDFTFTSTYTF